MAAFLLSRMKYLKTVTIDFEIEIIERHLPGMMKE